MGERDRILLSLLILVLLAGLILMVYAWFEARHLRISYFRLVPGRTDESERLEIAAISSEMDKIPQPDAASGPRMVFFSDYHAAMMRVPLPILINSIVQTKPDFVVFGGDLSTANRDLEKALSHLKLIGSALIAENVPFYGVWGNHDTVLTRESAEACGIQMLRNQSTVLRGPEGLDWLLIGLDDGRTGQPDLDAARGQFIPKTRAVQLKSRAAEIPASRTIVIAHNPDTPLSFPAVQLAWSFSGHYHGGQINLPFKLGYRMLRTDLAWRKNYLKGLYRLKDFGYFISRGMGCVSLPFRLWSPPELSVFDFTSTPL